jgi:transposase
VKQATSANKQQLIYNGSYSSELNPIERLWAWSKHKFRRDMITTANYDDVDAIQRLIIESIDAVKPSSLQAHIRTCLRMMKDYNANIQANHYYPHHQQLDE